VSAVSADYAGAAPVTAGNLLIAWIWYHTSSDQTVAGVADSAGNVYARADDVGVGEGALATGRQEVWYAKNARAAAGPAPTSITATFTGTVQPSVGLGVFEYANAEAAAPLVTASQQAGTGDEAVSPLAAIGEAKMVFGAVLFSGEGVHDLAAERRLLQRGNIAEDYLVSPLPQQIRATPDNPEEQSWIAQLVAFK
jgi:hypothetical protein